MRYLVALFVDDAYEGYDRSYYTDAQIVEADSKREAIAKYEELNRCNYFYASCLGEIDDNDFVICVDGSKVSSSRLLKYKQFMF